jgi:hypothetical protein
MKSFFQFTNLIAFCACLVFLSPAFSQSGEVLDNKGVVDMVKSGLPENIILKKIETTPNRFDLSTDSLVKLSNDGVSTNIVSAMMESGGKTVTQYHELVKQLEEPGIYFIEGEDLLQSKRRYMEPSVIDKVKEGSFGSHMAGALTSAAKKKVKAIVIGEKANLETGMKPSFLFYFGDEADKATSSQPQTDQNDPMAMLRALQNMNTADKIKFSGISSPNEMRLIKADEDKNERSFVASSASGMVKESGIDSDFIRQFRFERLESGLYEIYFEKPLEPGEYMFIYGGINLYQGQFVYDFSVR